MRALKLIVTTENVDFFIDFISHLFGVYSQTDDDNLKNPAWSDYGRDCQKKVLDHIPIMWFKSYILSFDFTNLFNYVFSLHV